VFIDAQPAGVPHQGIDFDPADDFAFFAWSHASDKQIRGSAARVRSRDHDVVGEWNALDALKVIEQSEPVAEGHPVPRLRDESVRAGRQMFAIDLNPCERRFDVVNQARCGRLGAPSRYRHAQRKAGEGPEAK
jgi:hypothetical protein